MQQLFICIMASRKPAAALHSTFAATMISYLPINCAVVVCRPCSRPRTQRRAPHTIRLPQPRHNAPAHQLCLCCSQTLLKAKDAEIRAARDTLAATMVPREEAEALAQQLQRATAAAAEAEAAREAAEEAAAAEVQSVTSAAECQVRVAGRTWEDGGWQGVEGGLVRGRKSGAGDV